MSAQMVIFLVFISFALLEVVTDRFLHKEGEVKSDGYVEIIGTVILLGITQPFILYLAYIGMEYFLPDAKDALIGYPVIAGIMFLIIFDDMMQYWWHRASHTFPFLYNLHRAHHNGEYLSVRTVYRNNVFYYFLMPSLWFSGILIYLGLGWIYAGYVAVKMTVIIGAHSSWRWDAALYKIPQLSWLMWIVERTISTPSTHSAHHGKHADDGITNYKGNFGNLLFFWDVLFGTAKITRKYPKKFGVENLPTSNWPEQLFWPLIKTKED
ncbi:sterol desaturase family protein [Kordiimonas sp. SCSIO 12610]|uniref:sterol desaturase family protein n=1 Tax=Kordiimonas sp. SCSIO 12610 TaxID=2829597 RepID=UPI00210B8EA1|nr:sterol desaturase family protein [Kordiimonas sp. SCSIO 12610]UTW55437.1 sterol desaturase family protein [Kordiimonas sp. SCSIO 12610]